MVFGEQAGKFHEARANSETMHAIADKKVDRYGPFSPSALLTRSMAVFYDMSPAPAAQEAGEVWGDPSTSKGQKAWSTGKLGLHLLEAIPVARVVSGAADGMKALNVGSRSSRTTARGLGLAGSVRRRQSMAGFAKTPGKAKTAAAASQSAREVSKVVQKVANTDEFFELTELGKKLVDQSQRTGKVFQGAQVHKMIEKVKIGKTILKKGYHYYLDNLHKDHIEVFDKRGIIKDVLNFAGESLVKKLDRAKAHGRNIKDLVSHENSMPKNHLLA